MFASTSNAVTVPGYTRIDGAVFYRLDKNIQLQMNVENLMDRKYYISANGDNNITPGSPRAVRVSLIASM
jgi:catecholate siderophore receptor